MNANKEKILQEYKIQSGLYNEFGDAVSKLLHSVLKQGEYKYHLDCRLKQADSLAKKIDKKSQKGKIYRSLSDIKDVTGIRIIFYSKADRQKFIQTMKKEFRGSLRLKETEKRSGYRAIHAIISLGNKRLRLSEYATFKNMECEVQLCLILEHAWAEIEHDILYKENWGFRDLDKINYVYMRDRMHQIMKSHINKASTELEKTISEFKKIKRETLTH